MSQIAFFKRDGDMRDRCSRISHPHKRAKRAYEEALIRATILNLTPMARLWGQTPVLRPRRTVSSSYNVTAEFGKMFTTTITGSLPKPPWLAEPGKLWAPWRPHGAALETAKRDA